MKTTFKNVEEVINVLENCYKNQVSEDKVKEQFSDMSYDLYYETFWSLYNRRNTYEGTRSVILYDHYDRLLDIFKRTSKYYKSYNG